MPKSDENSPGAPLEPATGVLSRLSPGSRAAAGAFVTLAAVMAGHALLETARDALFLARLPVAHLPWVYLAVTLGVIVVARAQQAFARFPSRRVLAVMLGSAAVVTFGFWTAFGALDLLEAEDRARLVPTLILYHPSRAVVLRALTIFETSRRADFLAIADRLLAHADAEVRAAALRARSIVRPEVAVLRAALGAAACAAQPRRFPLREPLWKDTDLVSVRLPCRADPTPKEPKHIKCGHKRHRDRKGAVSNQRAVPAPFQLRCGFSKGSEVRRPFPQER